MRHFKHVITTVKTLTCSQKPWQLQPMYIPFLGHTRSRIQRTRTARALNSAWNQKQRDVNDLETELKRCSQGRKTSGVFGSQNTTRNKM